jgi:hypothetical protein
MVSGPRCHRTRLGKLLRQTKGRTYARHSAPAWMLRDLLRGVTARGVKVGDNADRLRWCWLCCLSSTAPPRPRMVCGDSRVIGAVCSLGWGLTHFPSARNVGSFDFHSRTFSQMTKAPVGAFFFAAGPR